MKHELFRKDSSSSCESFITPTCSCGWTGKPVSNMYNWQMHEVSGQENRHIADVAIQAKEEKQ